MNISSYLKLISGNQSLVIRPTDGNSTIAQAKDIFTFYVDYDFANYGTDVKGKPTEETSVRVFETIKDGTLVQIFGGFGVR